MDNQLVGIIVPVYNAEKYLRECLDSILAQTYKNIEVILVDDGSTDESGTICDGYASQDDRIKVIHQQNGGAARARRCGVESTKAEYICFADSDDTIDSDMVEYFVSNIGGADLITTGCYCQGKNGAIFQKYDEFEEGCYATHEQMEYIYKNMLIFERKAYSGFLPFLVTKMFRKDIFAQVLAEVNDDIRVWEDRILLYPYLLKCRSVVVAKECFYFYRYNQESVMHSKNLNILSNLHAFYIQLEKVFKEHALQKSLIDQLEFFFTHKLYAVGDFMGFSPENKTIRYIFPYTNLLYDKHFVLYGAGAVGMDYYRQIRKSDEGECVLWVDKQWNRFLDSAFDVKGQEELKTAKYDCLILAVRNKVLAEDIKKELIEQGVSEEKIWWKEPILLPC